MNRKLAFAALTCGASMFATGAMAADLPPSEPQEAPSPYIAPPPPVFTWTGFYVGANAGVSFNGNSSPTFNPGSTLSPDPLSPSAGNTAGFTGGGEIGYNWQVNQLVFGVEGDVDYLQGNNVDGTYSSPAFYSLYPTYTLSGGNNNSVFGTLRGRVGWAFGRTLVYATGGLAFGGDNAPTTLTFNPSGGVGAGNSVFTATNTPSDIGAVVGGGLEYAFTQNWTGKVEYLHTLYDNKALVYANNAGQTFSTSGYNFDSNIVRVGLNYKF